MSIPIKCILAIDNTNGIANDGGIPWKFKEDLLFFQQITSECKKPNYLNAIIMGRKTWENIGKPLKNRLNVIITSTPILDNTEFDDTTTSISFFTYKQAITWLNTQQIVKIESIFIIGGKQLYDMCFKKNICSEIYLTLISQNYNTSVKIDINLNQYTLLKSTQIHAIDLNDPENGLTEITFNKYTNISENLAELKYLELLKNIMTTGNLRQTRNAKTYALFGNMLEFNLKNYFPLLTTKKMFMRGIFEELKFFLLGQTDTKILEEKGVNIWKGNTSREFLDNNNHKDYKEGDMGPMYGFQWLHFNAEYKGSMENYEDQGVNQLEDVINLLVTDKFSRRILMTTYNPSQSKKGVLYPCHGLTIQFAVEGKNNNEVVCSMYQRSVDCFLGLPFNIASYALLVHIICNICNQKLSLENKLIPGRLIMFLGDTHIYEEHIDAVQEQLLNNPFNFPQLVINKEIANIEDINNLEFNDIIINNYISHNSIKAQMIA